MARGFRSSKGPQVFAWQLRQTCSFDIGAQSGKENSVPQAIISATQIAPEARLNVNTLNPEKAVRCELLLRSETKCATKDRGSNEPTWPSRKKSFIDDAYLLPYQQVPTRTMRPPTSSLSRQEKGRHDTTTPARTPHQQATRPHHRHRQGPTWSTGLSTSPPSHREDSA